MKPARSLALLGSLVIGAQAAAMDVGLRKGHVEFLAIGRPSAIRIRGKGDDLTGQMRLEDGHLTGHFAFNLNSLDTGIALRNTHTKKKYLEIDKYPLAELELNPVAIPQNVCSQKVSLQQQKFTGGMRIHGVEKPVQGLLDLTSDGKGKGHSQARFNVMIHEYKIETPSYMNIRVTDTVENTVDLDWECSAPTAP